MLLRGVTLDNHPRIAWCRGCNRNGNRTLADYWNSILLNPRLVQGLLNGVAVLGEIAPRLFDVVLDGRLSTDGLNRQLVLNGSAVVGHGLLTFIS